VNAASGPATIHARPESLPPLSPRDVTRRGKFMQHGIILRSLRRTIRSPWTCGRAAASGRGAIDADWSSDSHRSDRN